ncbi:MAG: hypothetical protein ACLFUU_06460 [Desulfobacteraceae bacterium]
MRSLICSRHCRFFKPQADEAEKCLGYEFLAAWAGVEPRLVDAGPVEDGPRIRCCAPSMALIPPN